MKTIDFRSDTVTWPTVAMREAMAAAQVGDDVYGEDPTVNALERLAADILGKESSILLASGTMGNLVAIMSQATRGDEAIAGMDTHALTDEGGGLSVLGGVVPRALLTDEIGRMDLQAISSAVNPDDPHFARSKLILLENSYGARSGAAQPLDYFASVNKIARDNGLAVHLDGARIFNAAAALRVEAREIAAHVDSVSFCLSKGLCAPIGSMLCGSSALIHKARRIRKVLGGGMRQAGIIAAAGIVALEKMVQRLSIDNENAQIIAQRLEPIPGILIDPRRVQTNIVFFEVHPEPGSIDGDVVSSLRDEFGILIGSAGPGCMRLLTHYWVGEAEIDALIKAVDQIMRRRTKGNN